MIVGFVSLNHPEIDPLGERLNLRIAERADLFGQRRVGLLSSNFEALQLTLDFCKRLLQRPDEMLDRLPTLLELPGRLRPEGVRRLTAAGSTIGRLAAGRAPLTILENPRKR